jgi:DNA-binding transcriptional ArsR family regulator
MVVQVFKALGDPVRLQMIQRLSSGTRYTISSVSADLGITRQGARKHLDVLFDAKLITLGHKGRDVLVELDPKSLYMAKAFIAELEQRWDRRLMTLKDFVEKKNS